MSARISRLKSPPRLCVTAELAGPLSEALTAVAKLRPEDPLGLLAAVLYRRAAAREYRAVQGGVGVPPMAEEHPAQLAGHTESQPLTVSAGGEEADYEAADLDEKALLRRVRVGCGLRRITV